MERNLTNRIQATLLAVLTVGLVLLAVWNFHQEGQFPQPDDGVWWAEAGNGSGLVAQKVLPDTPGSRAGLKANDLLTAVNDSPVVRYPEFARELHRTGAFGNAHYTITRAGIQLPPVLVIPEPVDRSGQQAQRIIGLIYLFIGIYVLFRRWTAPRATHFYVFCLVSFALYALKVTGELDLTDWAVFWCNVLAESLQPALFLHFALSFPEERLKKLRRQWLLPMIYAPGAGYLFLWISAINRWQATELLRHRMDQMGTAYDAAYYVLA